MKNGGQFSIVIDHLVGNPIYSYPPSISEIQCVQKYQTLNCNLEAKIFENRGLRIDNLEKRLKIENWKLKIENWKLKMA